MAASVLVAASALAGGYDAGLIATKCLSDGSSVSNESVVTTNMTIGPHIGVDMSQFVGSVKLLVQIPASVGTNDAVTIRPTLESYAVTGGYHIVSTSVVSGTGFHTVTNGLTTFTAILEPGAFAYRYARLIFSVSETNDAVNHWMPFGYIIGNKRESAFGSL